MIDPSERLRFRRDYYLHRDAITAIATVPCDYANDCSHCPIWYVTASRDATLVCHLRTRPVDAALYKEQLLSEGERAKGGATEGEEKRATHTSTTSLQTLIDESPTQNTAHFCTLSEQVVELFQKEVIDPAPALLDAALAKGEKNVRIASIRLKHYTENAVHFDKIVTQQPFIRMKGHAGPIVAVTLSKNVGIFAASASLDGTVKVWLPLLGRCLNTIDFRPKPSIVPTAIVFTHQSRWALAVGDADGKIHCFDIEGKEEDEVKDEEGAVKESKDTDAAAVNAPRKEDERKETAAGGDGVVRLARSSAFNSEDGNANIFRGRGRFGRGRGGQAQTGGGRGTGRITWITACPSRNDTFNIVFTSTSGTANSYSCDDGRLGRRFVRDVEAGVECDPVLGCCVSPDGSLLATAYTDQTIHLWEKKEEQQLFVVRRRDWRGADGWEKATVNRCETIRAIAFSPVMYWLLVCFDRSIQIYDLEQRCTIYAITPDGYVPKDDNDNDAASNNESAEEYDPTKRKVTFTTFAVSSHGRSIFIGRSDGSVREWAFGDSEELK